MKIFSNIGGGLAKYGDLILAFLVVCRHAVLLLGAIVARILPI